MQFNFTVQIFSSLNFSSPVPVFPHEQLCSPDPEVSPTLVVSPENAHAPDGTVMVGSAVQWPQVHVVYLGLLQGSGSSRVRGVALVRRLDAHANICTFLL